MPAGVGALFGAATSILSSTLQQQNQLGLMSAQEGYGAYNTIMGPSWQKAGLVQAGYNPMLAVDRGAPMMNMPMGGPPNNPNIGGGAASAMTAFAQADLLKAQADQVRSNTLGPTTLPVLTDKDGNNVKDEYGHDVIDMEAVAQGGGPHAGAFMSAMQTAAGVGNVKALTNLASAQAAQGWSQAALNDSQRYLNELSGTQRSAIFEWAYRQAAADAQISEADLKSANAQAQVMGGKWGPFLKLLQNMAPVAHAASHFIP